MRTISLFVSSPSDVEFERKRVERVAERLNGELLERVRFKTIRWETKFYSAHKSFPEHIPEAADCDIVIAVFWSRLGTALPDTLPVQYHMADGRPYASGTAYEVLTAIAARKSADHPDVYVFRKTEAATVPVNDPAQRAEAERQWARLEAFFAESFRAPDGSFLAAFHEFRTTDQFEEQVEKLLLDWLDEHFGRDKTITWPIETKGSPFRGLAPFDARHAAVFFGRLRKVMRAVDHLKDAARRSLAASEPTDANSAERRLKPFLLIVGPSGSGKSSLMRAGVAPRITAPGVVPEVDCWRTAVMRPGDGANAFEALARALTVTGKGDDPGGFGPALPEIVAGGASSVSALAELFAAATPDAAAPVIAALEAVAAEERARGSFERPLRASLLLLVDQLEDVFAANVTDAQRTSFANLLSALCATKRIWIVATLRGDLYNRLIKSRAFIALKDAGTTYDLAPPGPDELGEIIQRSAEAAGLVYDVDPATGERLDDRLLQDAADKDILPLLEFTLDRLFEERSVVGEETRLTFASYRAMNGLGGAIDQSAERAVRRLGEAEIAALPRLLRALGLAVRDEAGSVGHEGLTVRAAPIDEVVRDEPTRRLVAALMEARIVLASTAAADTPEGEREEALEPGAGGGVLRIAHQRVFECWERARLIIHDHRDYFRIRGVVDDQRRRWQTSGRRPDLLIPDGRPLEEAEQLAARYGDEISRDTRNFISLSAARARRGRTIKRVMQGSLAVAAVVAIVAGIYAEINARRALRNYEAARTTVDSVVTSIAESLRDLDGISSSSVDEALRKETALVTILEGQVGADFKLQRTRAHLQYEFAKAFQTANNNGRALSEAMAALALRQALATLPEAEPDWQWDLALSLDQVGDIERAIAVAVARANKDDPRAKQGFVSAKSRYEQAYAVRQKLHADHPDIARYEHGLALSLVRMGDLERDADKVLLAYEQALAASIDVLKREPDGVLWQRELSWDYNKIGDARSAAKDPKGALAAYEKSLCTRRYLVTRDAQNTLWQRDVSYTLLRIATLKQGLQDFDGAHDALAEAVLLRRGIAARDFANSLRQRELAEILDSLSKLERLRKRPDVAAAFASAALDIAKQLTAHAPDLRGLGAIRDASQDDLKAALADLPKGGPFELASAPAELTALVRQEEVGFGNLIAQHQDPGACWTDLMASLGIAPAAGEATGTAR